MNQFRLIKAISGSVDYLFLIKYITLVIKDINTERGQVIELPLEF
jgi:hypothetical protein